MPRAGLMLALAVLPLVASMPVDAGDVAAGRRKALQCQACHGLDGLSKLPEAPHLAGQPERYLVKSLDEYRTGARKDEMMALVAKNLSDQISPISRPTTPRSKFRCSLRSESLRRRCRILRLCLQGNHEARNPMWAYLVRSCRRKRTLERTCRVTAFVPATDITPAVVGKSCD